MHAIRAPFASLSFHHWVAAIIVIEAVMGFLSFSLKRHLFGIKMSLPKASDISYSMNYPSLPRSEAPPERDGVPAPSQVAHDPKTPLPVPPELRDMVAASNKSATSPKGKSSEHKLDRLKVNRPSLTGREYDATIVKVFYATDRDRAAESGDGIKYGWQQSLAGKLEYGESKSRSRIRMPWEEWSPRPY